MKHIVAILVIFILAFILANCSSSDSDELPPLDSLSSGGGGSEVPPNWCIYLDEKRCLLFPSSVCPNGGILAPDCPSDYYVGGSGGSSSSLAALTPNSVTSNGSSSSVNNALPVSSSSLAAAAGNVGCFVGANCIETSQSICSVLEGIEVPYCPALSSSSANNALLASSSSLMAGNVFCIVSGNCIEASQSACVTIGGTQVSACPAVSPSSSSRPSSSSVAAVVPSSSSRPSSSSSRGNPTLGSTEPVRDLDTRKAVDVYSGDCMNIIVNWNQEVYMPPIYLNCSGINLNTMKTTGDAICNGSDPYMLRCDIGIIFIGLNNWNICVTFDIDTTIKCHIST